MSTAQHRGTGAAPGRDTDTGSPGLDHGVAS